jgi:hypothetical protein
VCVNRLTMAAKGDDPYVFSSRFQPFFDFGGGLENSARAFFFYTRIDSESAPSGNAPKCEIAIEAERIEGSKGLSRKARWAYSSASMGSPLKPWIRAPQ